jgi:hypothetical protein
MPLSRRYLNTKGKPKALGIRIESKKNTLLILPEVQQLAETLNLSMEHVEKI